MKTILIGEKIKELRLAKKLTQQEVVGDFITRNMLSKIENNSATPSVKTLEYLAQKLEVPPGTLLAQYEDSLVDDKQTPVSKYDRWSLTLAKARKELKQGLTDECIHTVRESAGEDLSDLPGEDCDEARIILAIAYLAKAQAAYSARDFNNAALYAQDSIRNNKNSLYYNQTLEAKATFLLNNSVLG